MRQVKHAKVTTFLSPSFNNVYKPCDFCSKLGHSFLPLPASDTAVRFPLTNKLHNNLFPFFKHVSPGDSLHRPAPGASPRAHVHSLGVDQGSTKLPSQVSVLFLFFFPVDKCLKTLFMCPSNLETRQQRDLYLCNKLRSVLKSSLAAAPEVEALSCSWCRATPGSHFYHSTAHSSATQQKTLPGKDTFIPINILFIHPCFSLSCTPC